MVIAKRRGTGSLLNPSAAVEMAHSYTLTQLPCRGLKSRIRHFDVYVKYRLLVYYSSA